jgi:hypothetical protein
MPYILNVKMRNKDLFKMRMENKPYGINFELGVYLQTTLQLESLVANYLQLQGSLYILYIYIYFCKLYDSIC